MVVDRADPSPGIDDHLAEGRLLERRLDRDLGRLAAFLLGQPQPGRTRLDLGRGVPGEDAALQVVGNEQVAAALQRLRLAEHEVAAARQGEIEVREYSLLRRCVEVHDRVPRQEQVDTRDRRILHQVVAAEDDAAADVAAKAQ